MTVHAGLWRAWSDTRSCARLVRHRRRWVHEDAIMGNHCVVVPPMVAGEQELSPSLAVYLTERSLTERQGIVPKKQQADPIPYAIQGSDHDQNVRFYERYDEN